MKIALGVLFFLCLWCYPAFAEDYNFSGKKEYPEYPGESTREYVSIKTVDIGRTVLPNRRQMIAEIKKQTHKDSGVQEEVECKAYYDGTEGNIVKLIWERQVTGYSTTYPGLPRSSTTYPKSNDVENVELSASRHIQFYFGSFATAVQVVFTAMIDAKNRLILKEVRQGH